MQTLSSCGCGIEGPIGWLRGGFDKQGIPLRAYPHSDLHNNKMALCWVKAGECGQETSIEARKISPVEVVFEITTTCEHIQALAQELGEVNVGHEMSRPLDETHVYTLATKHVCRNSCIVPAAILKAMEVTAGIFLPRDCHIEFVEGVV